MRALERSRPQPVIDRVKFELPYEYVIAKRGQHYIPRRHNYSLHFTLESLKKATLRVFGEWLDLEVHDQQEERSEGRNCRRAISWLPGGLCATENKQSTRVAFHAAKKLWDIWPDGITIAECCTKSRRRLAVKKSVRRRNPGLAKGHADRFTKRGSREAPKAQTCKLHEWQSHESFRRRHTCCLLQATKPGY